MPSKTSSPTVEIPHFLVTKLSKTGLPNLAALLAALCLALASADAFAYLDPATGSIILQGILAALAGAMLTARLYWARIKEFFGRNKEIPPDKDD